jgi:phosphoribosylformylglycinamidine synthase subunit PurS
MSGPTSPSVTLWVARIHILRKAAVVDPQGNTVLDALHQLHFDQVQEVRIGKYIEVTIHAEEERVASKQVDMMCSTLLTNPVIEQYTYTLSKTE